MRTEIISFVKGQWNFVYIFDQTEAMTLVDHIVIMKDEAFGFAKLELLSVR